MFLHMYIILWSFLVFKSTHKNLYTASAIYHQGRMFLTFKHYDV